MALQKQRENSPEENHVRVLSRKLLVHHHKMVECFCMCFKSKYKPKRLNKNNIWYIILHSLHGQYFE